MKASLPARAALALVATALALLVTLGVLAWTTDGAVLSRLKKLVTPRASRGVTHLGAGANAGEVAVRAPADRSAAGRSAAGQSATDESSGGLYRVHADPLVSYVLKPGTDRLVLAGLVRGDELGLRARAGPPRGPESQRIVVAGDSVAFGFGLENDEALATRLEQELNAALGPGAPPVCCRSVALPGWNHRNAVAAVLDHEDVLDPDIVVYLPISNDVYDTDGLDEAGFRRTMCDPSSADPWLLVNQGIAAHVDLESASRLRAAGRDDSWITRGPLVIAADLSPESSRRLDENAASVARLRQRMLDRGGHFLIAAYLDDSYMNHLLRRFDEQHVPIDVVPLFATIPAALKLPDDPHPNADTVAAMARWIAADLLARGWIAGAASGAVPEPAPDPAPVPTPVPAAIAAVRAPVHTPQEREALSVHTRLVQKARLVRIIDLAAGDGCNQIYGGVFPDGTAGPHALFLLPRPARTLLVQLAALPERPDLLPQDVSVQVDGVELGTLHLDAAHQAADGSVTARWPLPPDSPASSVAGSPGAMPHAAAAPLGPDPPMEVRLVASRWAVQPLDRLSAMVAYRVVRLEALPD